MDIRIDRSGQNPPPPNYKVIEFDIDFIRFAESDGDLWISGENLSRWATDFYRARGIPYQTVDSPRERLRRVVGHQVDALDDDLVNKLLNAVNYIVEDKTLDDVISAYTKRGIWRRQPTVKMLASWLIERVDDSLKPIVESWSIQKAEACKDPYLADCFRTEFDKRQDLFWEWIENTQSEIYSKLGAYPRKLSARFADLHRERLEKELRRTKGEIVDQRLFEGLNAVLDAEICYEYFRANADYITPTRFSKIAGYLKETQRSALKERLRVPSPEPVDSNASQKEVLNWVCESYLPFRRWETQFGNEFDMKLAIKAARSFELWIRQNYPDFTNRERDKTPLNINFPSIISDLSKNRRIFWIMVDGLNWLNYRKLVDKLASSEAEFGLESDKPSLSILPTITRYAKWSAVSGEFPEKNNMESWDIRKAFNDTFPNGQYVSSNDIGALKNALADTNLSIIFWNYTRLDAELHKQTDITGFMYTAESELGRLTNTISDLVLDAPENDNIAVLISSDHGQFLGPAEALDVSWEKQPNEVHGRMALGGRLKPDAPSTCTLELNRIAFRTPDKITIASDHYHFGGSYRTDANGRAWGVHGGLTPEECVIGQGVLTRNLKYKEIDAQISGEGEAGKAGTMILLIDNPNNFSLGDLILYSDTIESLADGQSVHGEVRGQDQRELKIPIASWPSSKEDNSLEFSGRLTFLYGDGRRGQSDVHGTLVCKSLYQRTGLSLRNRLRK